MFYAKNKFENAHTWEVQKWIKNDNCTYSYVKRWTSSVSFSIFFRPLPNFIETISRESLNIVSWHVPNNASSWQANTVKSLRVSGISKLYYVGIKKRSLAANSDSLNSEWHRVHTEVIGLKLAERCAERADAFRQRRRQAPPGGSAAPRFGRRCSDEYSNEWTEKESEREMTLWWTANLLEAQRGSADWLNANSPPAREQWQWCICMLMSDCHSDGSQLKCVSLDLLEST